MDKIGARFGKNLRALSANGSPRFASRRSASEQLAFLSGLALILFGLFLVLTSTELQPTDRWGVMVQNQGPYKQYTHRSGIASWYGAYFAGRPTASGEIFQPEAWTAAHKTLPLGTRVRVTNPDNGRSAIVRINDRGPYIEGRSIDLSQRVARFLDLEYQGIGEVRIEVLEYPRKHHRTQVRPEENPNSR